MARIPDTEIERLKEEVSVERLIESAGIELKKSGKDLAGCCPFHEDDTASLIVTPAKNLWHCFGCQCGGGPIDWVMKKDGVSFRHAVELLREGMSGISSLAAEPVKHSTVRTLAPPVAFDADDQELLNQTVAYYHERLLATADAADYLAARGLTHPELIGHFLLGVADRTLGLRLPDKRRVAGADIRNQLQKIGLYRESGHEHFNGSLVVPIFDEQGNVIEVYGRKLRDDLRAGTPKHLYLPADKRSSARRGIFNREALQHKEIILCEAILDALTFWNAGYRNVTTAYGIEGFTDEMLEAFKQSGVERILIAFDRDEPGERAAAKLSERLIAEGFECWRIQFPKGMDANDYALKVTPAYKSLGLLIRKAVWIGKGEAPKREAIEIERPAQTEAPLLPLVAAPQAPAQTAPVENHTAPPEPTLPDPLPASPMPEPIPEPPIAVSEREVMLSFGEGEGGEGQRRWRIRGLSKNLAVELLKVNVMVRYADGFHVDTLDLYSAKARSHYVAQAADELGLDARILKTDLGRVLLALEQQQDRLIDATLQTPADPQHQMAEHEQAAALAWLKSPDLIAQILADFDACGLTGESTNKLVGYLAAISRKLDRPLGVVIQSSSAAGKTTLMDAVLDFVPEEDKVKYSAMSGQSLFYIGETNLKHKILAIAEEEGASRASYALKLLQSEGELTMASTGKDATGNLVTQSYRVEGPVALLLTTTARDLDEELMNRCLVLSVDEGREQTRAIHERQRQRRTLEGLLARQDKQNLIALHQNVQRLIRPLAVLNPYAQHLSFPDQSTRLRRDHEKYLTLIDTIALLHQHQRPLKTCLRGGVGQVQSQAQSQAPSIEYLEVTLDDIEQANAIAHEVLGRSLDELPPQTRRLLRLIDEYVKAACTRQQCKIADLHFSRRALREAIHWGDTQLKVHLSRLVELEYLIVHRAAGNSYEYELAYEFGDEEGVLRFPGLADINTLKHAYDLARSGQTGMRSAPGQGVVAPESARGRNPKTPPNTSTAGLTAALPSPDEDAQYTRKTESAPSYPHPVIPLAAAVPLAATGATDTRANYREV